jgi:hypothetical protein
MTGTTSMKNLILGLVAAASLAAALPAMAQTLPAREQMQHARIEQGVRSGALTPRAATHLERREMATHRLETRLRVEHGGRLTRRDHMIVRHALNRDSRAIHRMKHDHRVG